MYAFFLLVAFVIGLTGYGPTPFPLVASRKESRPDCVLRNWPLGRQLAEVPSNRCIALATDIHDDRDRKFRERKKREQSFVLYLSQEGRATQLGVAHPSGNCPAW